MEPRHTLEAAAQVREGLTERGNGFDVGCSVGLVILPEQAATAAEALRIADRRLYAAKHDGRRSAEHQTKDVLLRALVERDPDLVDHSTDVAALAEAVARAFGLSPAEAIDVRHAAELHDVGKVAIPDAILRKPGRLDDVEWAFIRQHTLIGERILGAAPALARVAPLVRSTHERWDGLGYPDGLAGTDIPLGARIVAVADAYDAMVSERPYAAARSHACALYELRRCAGSQFDPDVVEAYCAELDARRVRARERARAAA
jgi:two-component system cell cycle response regulator